MNTTQAWISIAFATGVGLFLAWAGSRGGASFEGLPIFPLLIALAFFINWLAFIPAYRRQSEKFYDLTGGLTYISMTLLALWFSPGLDARSYLLGGMILVWAIRLATFLFRRIRRAGKDGRFDEIKVRFAFFLNAWTLQALWVSLTSSAALIAISSGSRKELDWLALLGVLLWILGFGIEVLADLQKSRFRTDEKNKDRFIQSGLWAYSRHPNYLGEIILWIGVLLIAVPVLQGWQWIGLISPIFVAFLLTRISGIPMLEERADRKWGGQPAYEAYKKRTAILIPWIW